MKLVLTIVALVIYFIYEVASKKKKGSPSNAGGEEESNGQYESAFAFNKAAKEPEEAEHSNQEQPSYFTYETLDEDPLSYASQEKSESEARGQATVEENVEQREEEKEEFDLRRAIIYSTVMKNEYIGLNN